jgi:hypothetical protein
LQVTTFLRSRVSRATLAMQMEWLPGTQDLLASLARVALEVARRPRLLARVAPKSISSKGQRSIPSRYVKRCTPLRILIRCIVTFW